MSPPPRSVLSVGGKMSRAETYNPPSTPLGPTQGPATTGPPNEAETLGNHRPSERRNTMNEHEWKTILEEDVGFCLTLKA
jgi:hypothetical protein